MTNDRKVNAATIIRYAKELALHARKGTIEDIEKITGLLVKETMLENRTHHLLLVTRLVEEARKNLTETRRRAIEDVAQKILERATKDYEVTV